MKMMNRPLYPMHGDGWGYRDAWDLRERESWRMPLFRCEPAGQRPDCGCPGQTVRLRNPCCPAEYADVTLSVDSCGNLVLCVHRTPWKNDCRPRCPG